MKRELAGSLVFDASAVLDLLYSTRGGVKIREALKNEKVSASITEVNLAEVMYVLCRRLGSKEAIVPIAVIPTGAISFDAALGVGGFPRGRGV